MMRAVNLKPEHLLMIGGVVVLAVWASGGLRGLAQGAGAAVGGAAAGVVEGLGLAIGVPLTDANKCAQAKAEGSAFGMATYCPLGDFASGVLHSASDIASGTVLAAGDVLGVPRTTTSACEAAKAAGDYLGASFHCPAGDFLGWTWDKVTK